MAASDSFDAIIVAGGAAERLGGRDKPALTVGARSMLQCAVDAVAGAHRIVVAGPERALNRAVRWCREDPPGGGPTAGVVAALPHVSAATVVVLAADLPEIEPAVGALLRALGDEAAPDRADAAALVDPDGRVNYLAAAWHAPALRRAAAACSTGAGVPLRALYAQATLIPVPDLRGWGRDCDTWEEITEARRRAATSREGTDG